MSECVTCGKDHGTCTPCECAYVIRISADKMSFGPNEGGVGRISTDHCEHGMYASSDGCPECRNKDLREQMTFIRTTHAYEIGILEELHARQVIELNVQAEALRKELSTLKSRRLTARIATLFRMKRSS